MPHVLRHVAYVAILIVEGARVGAGAEHCHASVATDVILPLIGISVPMQLAHPAGLDFDICGGNVLRGAEYRAVNDTDRAAWALHGCCLHHAEHERIGHGAVWICHLVLLQRRRDLALENVEVVARDVGEVARLGAEVLGQHLFWQVSEPLADEEGVVLVEVAVIEHQQELAPLVERLDGVREAAREIPEVALLDVGDEAAPVVVDAGDAGVANEHQRPFVRLVPVQLADGARIEPHIDAGHLGRDRELADGGLPGPSAGLQAVVAEVERPFEVRQAAAIGEHAGIDVRVFGLDRPVAWAWVGAAFVAADGLWVGLCQGCAGGKQATSGSGPEDGTAAEWIHGNSPHHTAPNA